MTKFNLGTLNIFSFNNLIDTSHLHNIFQSNAFENPYSWVSLPKNSRCCRVITKLLTAHIHTSTRSAGFYCHCAQRHTTHTTLLRDYQPNDRPIDNLFVGNTILHNNYYMHRAPAICVIYRHSRRTIALFFSRTRSICWYIYKTHTHIYFAHWLTIKHTRRQHSEMKLHVQRRWRRAHMHF